MKRNSVFKGKSLSIVMGLVGAMVASTLVITKPKDAEGNETQSSDHESPVIQVKDARTSCLFDEDLRKKNFSIDQFKDRVFDSKDRPYESFWQEEHKSKVAYLPFPLVNLAEEVTQTVDQKFFDQVPEEVVSDLSIHFNLYGHALNDILKFKKADPKKYEKEFESYRNYNIAVAQRRLDSVKEQLMELGISEDRIHMNNMNMLHHKRAVEVEVCDLDQ